MKKISIFVLLITALVLTTGCSNDLSKKVEKLEKEKEKLMESSGYNECVRKINEREENIETCINEKLSSLGYDDGVDCIMEFTNPVCDEIDRYNAQVNASNDCDDELRSPTDLNILDCMKLLE